MADKVLKFDTDKAGQDITALGESVNQIDAMVETMTQMLEEMCGLWNSSNGDAMLQMVGQQVKAIQLYDYVHYACTVLQNANVNYQVAMKFDQKAFQDMSNLYM